ncbi:hypothetical protein KI387_011645, partial [Taxus chinensis]
MQSPYLPTDSLDLTVGQKEEEEIQGTLVTKASAHLERIQTIHLKKQRQERTKPLQYGTFAILEQ